MKDEQIKHKAKKIERPILFSTQMVRAILDGMKTQTRRPIPILPKRNQSVYHVAEDKYCFATDHANGYVSGMSEYFRKPYEVGDYLWVRETWNHENYPYPYQDGAQVFYRADLWDDTHGPDGEKSQEGKYRHWLPSIHMPRSASRLTLEVTAIRTEPLLEISDMDAIKEGTFYSLKREPDFPILIGIDWDGVEKALAPGVARADFSYMWRSIYPSGPKSWNMAPWVWVIDFEVVK